MTVPCQWPHPDILCCDRRVKFVINNSVTVLISVKYLRQEGKDYVKKLHVLEANVGCINLLVLSKPSHLILFTELNISSPFRTVSTSRH